MAFKITIKNYRCFSDENPLILDIGSGFVALVGPNNSGKSSAIRFFYELKNCFERLRAMYPSTLCGKPIESVSYADVPDPDEIFCDLNQRPLEIEIEVTGDISPSAPSNLFLSRLIGKCERGFPDRWHWKSFARESSAEIRTRKDRGWRQQNEAALDDGVLNTTHAFEVISNICESLYFGPFRNAINQGASDYYDMRIGSSFVDTWNEWKTGDRRKYRTAIGNVTEDIKRIFDYRQLEINASAQKKNLTIYVNSKPYRLQELGAGLAQFILVLGNAAIRRPPLIFIDEPELHLHPTLVLDFLTSLASYSKGGVVYATHSIGLARATAERIYSFQKIGDVSVTRPFEQTSNFTEFVGSLSFSSFKEMGHDTVLLVEGVSDVRTVQQFLRLMRKDHKIVVMPLGGSQLIRDGVEQELGELRRLTKNIAALIDSERDSADAEISDDRKAFLEICNKVGIQTCVTRRKALENYFTERAIKETFGDNMAPLGPYDKLKGRSNAWSKSDNWRVARQMALEDISGTDVGVFLNAI